MRDQDLRKGKNPMTKRPFDAIIFDHDGTLIDTESPDFRAWEILYKELGVSLSIEHWAETCVGHMNGYDQLFAELIERSDHGMTKARLRKRLEALWDLTLKNVELMPGAIDLLSQLYTAGYPLGVATASDRAWAMRWLNHFNLLPYFQVVANSDDIIYNKPAPDVYLFAAAQLGVQPERCLVFEDSLAGVRSAKSAGMMVIAVPNLVTQMLDLSQADAVIDGLKHVTVEWIVELGEGLA